MMRAPLSVRDKSGPSRRSFSTPKALPVPEPEEARGVNRLSNLQELLVADVRAQLTPSQMVENKLLSALTRVTVLVSQVRSRCLGGSRLRG